MFNDVENVRSVDFWNNPIAATEEINNWISQQTNGKIDPMYSETLDPDTAMILVSSLYFKASWNNEFRTIYPPLSTEKKDDACWPKSFDSTSDCDKRVQFMKVEDDMSVVTVNDNGKPIMEVIEIPIFFNLWKSIKFNGEVYGNEMQFHIWIPKDEDIRDPNVDKKVIWNLRI